MGKNSKALGLFLTLIIILSCLTLLTVKPASAQNAAPASSLPSSTIATVAWNRTYTDSNLQSVASAFQAVDGGFILAGITASNGIPAGLELMKIDSSGNPLWSKIYPGTAGGMSNFAKWIVQTSDGGYAIAGQFEGKAWLAKLDVDGKMQWNKSIGESAQSSANTLIKASDGGFALTGFSLINNQSSASTWLIKTDAFGNQQLNTVLNGVATGVDSIIQTSDGGYTFTTETSRMILDRGEIKTDCTLTKIDANGSQQWSQLYPDFGFAWSIVQTNDGGYVLGGGKGFALLKANSFGVMQWNQSYDSGQAWVMTQTSDSGFALAGTALIKTDATGSKQWALNFSDGDHAYIVIQANDGGYLCAGQRLLGTDRTSWVAKINIIPTPAVSPSPIPPEFTSKIVSSSIEITIKNQPITAYIDKNDSNPSLYYMFRFKDHENFQDWNYAPEYFVLPSTYGTYFMASNSDYSIVSFPIGTYPLVGLLNSGYIDVQVIALIGNEVPTNYENGTVYGFDGVTGVWSSTQTIAVPLSSSSPTPIGVGSSTLAFAISTIVMIIALVVILLFIRRHRKTNN